MQLGAIVGILGVLVLADVLFAPRALQIKMQDYQRQRLLVYFGIDFASKDATPEERAKAQRLRDGQIVSSDAGIDFRGFRRVAGQGLVQRRPDRARVSARRRGP